MSDPHLVQIDTEHIDDSVKEPVHIADLFGMFKTTSSDPTGTKPTHLIDQIKIYTNGITYRLYWYDATNSTWHFVTATA